MPQHFFTADLHAGHDNIIKFCNRPFTSVNQMNWSLIDNWNSKVNKSDYVWVLGDLSFMNQEKTADFVSHLHGRINVILGNHDKTLRGPVLNFLDSDPVAYKELSFAESRAPRGKLDIILFHYPIISWNKAFYGSWHLHGHVHSPQNKRKKPGRKMLDVGVDGNDFYPYSYSEICEVMNEEKELNDARSNTVF